MAFSIKRYTYFNHRMMDYNTKTNIISNCIAAVNKQISLLKPSLRNRNKQKSIR